MPVFVVHTFSPAAAYKAPSCMMRASLQTRGFPVNSCSVLLSPVSEGCSIFNIRDLPSPGMSFLVGYPILNEQP